MATQDLSTKKQSFMARYSAAAEAFLRSREVLAALHREWLANDYADIIVQDDITSGALLHLTPAIMAGGMFAQEQLELHLTNGQPIQGEYQTNWNALVG
jgi:hypothetical protein